MKPTINESFLQDIFRTFSDHDQLNSGSEGLAHRRSIVRSLLSHLAARFDPESFDLVEISAFNCGHDIQSVAIPQEYKYSIDEGDRSTAVTPEVLGSLVEQFGSDRVKSGAYYTPPAIAAFMCRRSLELVTGVSATEIESLPTEQRQEVASQLARMKVVDPACGSGAFLVAMHYELAGWRARLGTTTESNLPSSLQVYGLDLDELTVAAARIRLASAAKATGQKMIPEQLRRAIKVGDGLASCHDLPADGEYDIVVTNPPYGVAADIATRNRFFDPKRDGIQSRDLCGLFIARSLQLARPGGIAILLVSDTWRTIRRHLPLRKLLANTVKVVGITDLPPWIFPATVNTGIVVLKNSPPRKGSVVCSSDLRSTPKGAWDKLAASLEKQAHHTYQQSQASQYSRFSFFIASPRLHRILTDSTFTTLGEIASVRQGLATGDNKRYLRKLRAAHGAYLPVNPECIVTSQELTQLSTDEKRNGLSHAKFGKRVFVPYDKGGASAAQHGWLPNYYVPTEYFIDWSEEAVSAMKTTTSSRQGGKVGSRFQNAEYYFKQGITCSYTGYYAPSFRLSSGGVFDVGGSSCFDLKLPLYPVLAILASKLMKYIAKNYINHTVNFQVDDFKALPVPRELKPQTAVQLEALVAQIVAKQKIDPRYPYHRSEQAEVDKIINEMYGLGSNDGDEIDFWFARRYKRLFHDANI